MDFIALYFSHRRFKIVLTGLYILMSVFLTQSILSSFGIRYMFPEKIDLAVWLAFVMSRTILMPLITFLIVCGCFNAVNKGLNYLLYRAIRARIPLFKGLRQGVTNMAVPLHWFKWANGKYERMRK
jgi:hypothetical protein